MARPVVFAIVELLELILLDLPPRDILISQRVSRFWKSNIGGSHRLQQALFLRSEGLADKYSPAVYISTPQKPLPLRRYEPLFSWNPLLEPLIGFGRNWDIDCKGRIALTWDYQGSPRTSWEQPRASWRSMLLTKPAVKEINVIVGVWVGSKLTTTVRTSVCESKGVTAGAVLDLVKWIRMRKLVEVVAESDGDVPRVTARYRHDPFPRK